MKSFAHTASAALLVCLTWSAMGPAAAQDAAAGAIVFKKCAPCHSTDGSKRIGPTLAGVFGRKAGSLQGFRYSRAMKNAAVVWDDKNLGAYLAAPRTFIPGNVMPFSGLPSSKDRADVIAYLSSIK